MPTTETPTFHVLALEATRQFSNRLKESEYDKLTPSETIDAVKLMVSVDDEFGDLERQLRYGARALADECNRLRFNAFGELVIPNGVEHCERISNGNISLRMVKIWDVMRGKICVRMDVVGKCLLPEVASSKP